MNIQHLLNNFENFASEKEPLLTDCFNLKNKEIPVLQSVDELKPEYIFIDIRKDKVKMLDQQLANIEKVIKTKTDYIPFLLPQHTIGEYSEPFGTNQKWYDDKDPVTLPAINNPEDIKDLKPDLKNSKLLNRTLDTLKYFQKRVGTSIAISTCPPIGPLLCSSLIMSSNGFYTGLILNPKEMHYLIDMTTNVFIEFYERQLDILKNPAFPGFNYVYSKNARGVSISEDVLPQISPELLEEYLVPSLEKIADRFDGIIVHSCGNWMNSIDLILKIKGLRGINFHSSPVEMDPEIILKKVKESGKDITVFTDFGKIGINWTNYFKDEKDAYVNWYLKKILINGFPKGVFISTYDNYPNIIKIGFGINRENVSIDQMSSDYDWIKYQVRKILKENNNER